MRKISPENPEAAKAPFDQRKTTMQKIRELAEEKPHDYISIGPYKPIIYFDSGRYGRDLRICDDD